MKTLIIPPKEINNDTMRAFCNEICELLNQRFGNIPDDSEATDAAGAVVDLNALLEVLR